MPELVVDKGEKESRGNNFSLKFHFALVEEHPLDIHAAIRIIANFFALDVSHNKPREYVFSVTLTRYGQWTTNEKNIYIFFFLFFFFEHAFLFMDLSRCSMKNLCAIVKTCGREVFHAICTSGWCNSSQTHKYRWN